MAVRGLFLLVSQHRKKKTTKESIWDPLTKDIGIRLRRTREEDENMKIVRIGVKAAIGRTATDIVRLRIATRLLVMTTTAIDDLPVVNRQDHAPTTM